MHNPKKNRNAIANCKKARPPNTSSWVYRTSKLEDKIDRAIKKIINNKDIVLLSWLNLVKVNDNGCLYR